VKTKKTYNSVKLILKNVITKEKNYYIGPYVGHLELFALKANDVMVRFLPNLYKTTAEEK
jgi:hypothetical protein